MMNVRLLAPLFSTIAAMQLATHSVHKTQQDPWGAADSAVVVEDVVVERPLVQTDQALMGQSNQALMGPNLGEPMMFQDIQDIVEDVLKDMISDFPDAEAANLLDNVTNISAANVSADGATLDSVAQDQAVAQEVAVAGTPNTAIVNSMLNQADAVPVEAAPVVAIVEAAPHVTAAPTVVKAIGKDCKDVSGHYKNKAGNLVTLTQNGCDLEALLVSDTADEEVLTGAVHGMFITAAGIPNMGAVVENDDIKFMDGPHWTKLNEMDQHFLKQDGCSDLNGYYAARTGKLVSIKQVGCRVVLSIADGDSQGTVTKPGSVADEELRVFNLGKPGRLDGKGGLVFPNGDRWAKLSEEAGEKAATDDCSNVAGNFRDANGIINSVVQTDCHVNIQMYWDDEQGHVTIGGYVFGDMVVIKGFDFLGQFSIVESGTISTGKLHFTDGKDWSKLSDEESKELGIPEAGCSNFNGVYADVEGKHAVINQTECKVEVTFWLSSLNMNLTRDGYVSSDTLHIQDFNTNGFASNGNIAFGQLSMWQFLSSTIAGFDVPILANATDDASDDASDDATANAPANATANATANASADATANATENATTPAAETPANAAADPADDATDQDGPSGVDFSAADDIIDEQASDDNIDWDAVVGAQDATYGEGAASDSASVSVPTAAPIAEDVPSGDDFSATSGVGLLRRPNVESSEAHLKALEEALEQQALRKAKA